MRTPVHIACALVWAFLASYAGMRYLESAPATADTTVWAVRVLVVMLVAGAGVFAVLLSWLRHDVALHGKSNSTALAYALASVPSCGLAMVAYFYATRARREATLAAVQFAAVCLLVFAAVMVGVGP